ncbi:MAG: hypothetical protein KDC82_02945 [Bacteroidetes bacterium]|nr:hypothetical protein [Bacteroidota bacterium]
MKVLKEVFGSKKFLAGLGGIIAVLLHKFFNIPEDTTMQIVGLIASYIIGQGLADFGKEKAKIEMK